MSSTNIHIRITDRVEPVRKRITIPQSDLGTQKWFDAQRDPSTSVRLLILDEVGKNGFVDRVNKFGAPLRSVPPVSAAPAGPTAPTFTAPTFTAPTVSAVPPVAAVPTVSAVPPMAPAPVVDPRDAEIALLRDQLDQMKDAASPFLTYFVVGSSNAA